MKTPPRLAGNAETDELPIILGRLAGERGVEAAGMGDGLEQLAESAAVESEGAEVIGDGGGGSDRVRSGDFRDAAGSGAGDGAGGVVLTARVIRTQRHVWWWGATIFGELLEGARREVLLKCET